MVKTSQKQDKLMELEDNKFYDELYNIIYKYYINSVNINKSCKVLYIVVT